MCSAYAKGLSFALTSESTIGTSRSIDWIVQELSITSEKGRKQAANKRPIITSFGPNGKRTADKSIIKSFGTVIICDTDHVVEPFRCLPRIQPTATDNESKRQRKRHKYRTRVQWEWALTTLAIFRTVQVGTCAAHFSTSNTR